MEIDDDAEYFSNLKAKNNQTLRNKNKVFEISRKKSFKLVIY